MAERFVPIEDQYHSRALFAFRLVNALKTRKLTVEQIAYITQGTTRTSYRYLRTLHEAGFTLMREDKKFFIDGEQEIG
jgi:DNA-binding IclR family transcriptional regulator